MLALSSITAAARAECSFGRDTCLQGYVWRDAFPGDHVCVTVTTRTQTAHDNSQADARREPGGGASNPDTCRQGYVWRQARPDDHVCVPVATRTQTAHDNSQADARRDPNCAKCLAGREVVIPSGDKTNPTVVLDIQLPNGQILSTSSSPFPSKVTAPSGSTVKLTAKASDDQGVKDVQLWIGTESCSFDSEGNATCAGPGLLGKPTASNRDTGSPGQKGCTERRVSHELIARKTSSVSVSYEVSTHALNFGGGEVQLPRILVEAQPSPPPRPPRPPLPRCSSTQKCCGVVNSDGRCDGQCQPRNSHCR